jgi:hypothetical protein
VASFTFVLAGEDGSAEYRAVIPAHALSWEGHHAKYGRSITAAARTPSGEADLCSRSSTRRLRAVEWETELALVLTDDQWRKPEAGKPDEPQDCRELLKDFADAVNVTAWEVLSRYHDELNR